MLADERALYDTDRRAWAARAAGNWRGLIARGNTDDLVRLWGIAGPDLRHELLRQSADILLPRWAGLLRAATGARKALLWRRAGAELQAALRAYAAGQGEGQGASGGTPP